MGTVATSNRKHGVTDRGKIVEADVTFSASYATGGDTLDLSLLGLNGVREMLMPSHDIITRKPVTDRSALPPTLITLAGTETAPKLKFSMVADTEMTAATDLTGFTLRFRFVGY